MTWEPLADADPLPGDPDALAGVASTLGLTGSDLATHALTVGGVDAGPAFVGLAADQFVALRDRTAEQLGLAGERCAASSEALLVWSAALADAQGLGRAALRLAQQADDDRASARAGLSEREAFDAPEAPATGLAAAFPGLAPGPAGPWTGPDWAAAVATAEADLEEARALLDEAVAARDRDAATAEAALADASGDGLGDTWWQLHVVPLVEERLAAVGVRPPTHLQFVRTEAGLVLNTPAGWRYQSYAEAGIDPEAWVPARGLEANDQPARAAWDYYRTLYLSDPERYEWAGLAWFAGATVYAGVQDLSVTTDALRQASDLDEARELLGRLYPAGRVELLLAGATLPEVVDGLEQVEADMMGMQRQVFDDIAWQHVAFREGGLEAMEGVFAVGFVGRREVGVWRDIDRGRPEAVARANRNLAYVEQHDVIGDDFTRLRTGRGVVGHAFTLATSAVAASPVPGGRAFREVVPYEVAVDTPDRLAVVPDRLVPDRVPGTGWRVPGGDGVAVDLPDEAHLADLPVNDVSLFRNRWAWITDDMLPAYRRFLARHGWDDYAHTPLVDIARDRRVVDDDLLEYRP